MPQIQNMLLQTKLDEYIEKIAFSLNFPLNLFLTSKYYLRKSHIEPNGIKYRVFAFCLLIFTISLYLCKIFAVNDLKVKKTQFKFDLYSPSFIIHCIMFIVGFTTIFILDIVHKDNIVLLILKIQTIHRNIDYRKSIRSYIIWNWISTTTMIGNHILFSNLNFDPTYSFDLSYIRDEICDLLCIGFDDNIIISIRLIILLRRYLENWKEEVFMINVENVNDDKWLQLFNIIFKNILEAYSLYKKIFQVLVSSKHFHTATACRIIE